MKLTLTQALAAVVLMLSFAAAPVAEGDQAAAATNRLTRDEARRIAANIANLPELLRPEWIEGPFSSRCNYHPPR